MTYLSQTGKKFWKKPKNSGSCQICGIWRLTLHKDHIVPKAIGGKDNSDNRQNICANCHEDKTQKEFSKDMVHVFSKANPLKELWATPEFREKMKKIMGSEKYKENQRKRNSSRREKMRSHWKNPAFREHMTRIMQSEEYKEKQRRAHR